MNPQTLFPVAAAAILVPLMFLSGRLNEAAQPLRLELAQKAEHLLARDDVPREIRRRVEFMLNTAFGMRGVLLLAAIILSATPRFPDEDSIRMESGFRIPSLSAASTISFAAFSLIEPAKLKPSHFRKSVCPKID